MQQRLNILAPVPREGELQEFSILIDMETGEPVRTPSLMVTEDGERAWAWWKENVLEQAPD